MLATPVRHLTLLACLAAPAAACGDNETFVPIDSPLPDSSTEGIAQKALQFTGTQSTRAQVVSTAIDDITLEAWIRWDGGTTTQVMAYNGDSSTSGHGLLVETGIALVLLGGKDFVRCTGCVLSPGTWSHLAAVRSGGTWAIYKDGTAGALTGPVTLDPAPPLGAFAVGSNHEGGNNFNGAIDEVRVWNVARTGQEIARDRTVALADGEAGLAAYYRFDEGSGAMARDATSARHDLELRDGPMWISSGAMLTSRR